MPILFSRKFSEKLIKDLVSGMDPSFQEGFFIRTVFFPESQMLGNMFIRITIKNKIHQMKAEIVKNSLAGHGYDYLEITNSGFVSQIICFN